MLNSQKLEEKSIHALALEGFDLASVWDTKRFDVAGGVDFTVVPLLGQSYLCDGALAITVFETSGARNAG